MADTDATRDFGAKLLQIYTGGMLTNLINIGYRTGLFEAAAAGPATVEQLSARARLQERYVREWLGAMTSSGIVDHDRASGQFALPPERAALLTGDRAANVAPTSGVIVHMSKHVPALAECFRHGGGVGYDAFRPEFTAFDAVHDQREPAKVLDGVHAALKPDGQFLMIEFKFESDIADNVGNPFAPLYYGFSTMHCTTVSLAAGGPGLGAVWGDRTARAMLGEAGFSRIERLDSPRPQNCIYVCRK
jgi:hypothetical protein